MNILATIYSELDVSVGGLAVDLKGVLNIGKLNPAFPVRFAVSQPGLCRKHANSYYVTQYINRLRDRALGTYREAF